MNYRFLSTLALVLSMYSGVKAADSASTMVKPQVTTSPSTMAKHEVATSNLKIGYVDFAYICENLPEAKKNNAEIQSYQKQLDNQTEAKYRELQEKAQVFEREANTLTEAQRKQKIVELQKIESAFRDLEAQKHAKIIEKYKTVIQPLNDKIQAVISEVAMQHAYTFIFSKNTEAGPVLFFGQKSFDISDLVLEKVKAMAPKQEMPPVVGSKAQMPAKAASKTGKPVSKK